MGEHEKGRGMNRIRRALLAGAVASFGLVGAASPAAAGDCSRVGSGDVDASQACAAAATVVCKVIAKGQPCLN